jgi:hypothetical protein
VSLSERHVPSELSGTELVNIYNWFLLSDFCDFSLGLSVTVSETGKSVPVLPAFAKG